MGLVVTFYSFKGGVGRSMALANIAVLLGMMNKKVLMIDWDLEAPGLDKYFLKHMVNKDQKGLIDLLLSKKEEKIINWAEYSCKLNGFRGSQNISIIPSGLKEGRYHDYLNKLNGLDWDDFFEIYDGACFLDELRQKLIAEFDFVLIDSRTGVSDSGGICTILMPDIIMPLFTGNEQSIMGVKNIVVRSQMARQKIAFDRANIVVFPIFSRFEGKVEYALSKSWLERSSKELKVFYSDWLPKKGKTVLEVLEKTKIPYVPYFSFGELVAVIEDDLGEDDISGIVESYSYIAYMLVSEMNRIEDLFVFSAEALMEKGRINLKKGHSGFKKEIVFEYLSPKDSYSNRLNFHTESIIKNNAEYEEIKPSQLIPFYSLLPTFRSNDER